MLVAARFAKRSLCAEDILKHAPALRCCIPGLLACAARCLPSQACLELLREQVSSDEAKFPQARTILLRAALATVAFRWGLIVRGPGALVSIMLCQVL